MIGFSFVAARFLAIRVLPSRAKPKEKDQRNQKSLFHFVGRAEVTEPRAKRAFFTRRSVNPATSMGSWVY